MDSDIGAGLIGCDRRVLIFGVLSACLVSLALILGSSSCRAEGPEQKPFAGFTKYLRYHVSYDVNADGTHVETHEWALQILTEQGLELANHASVSYSDQLQTAEILSAYTLKKNGRRIDVPAANFQEESQSRQRQRITDVF